MSNGKMESCLQEGRIKTELPKMVKLSIVPVFPLQTQSACSE